MLWVFIGGGLGAAARYWLSGAMYRWTGSAFPFGTMTVNVVGCFIIGLLQASLEGRFLAAPALRVFLTIGILGGFTTFSSLSYETIRLFVDSEVLYGMANILVTVAACLGATYIGMVFGKLM